MTPHLPELASRLHQMHQLALLIALASVLPVIGLKLFLGVILCARRLLKAAVLTALALLAVVLAAVPLRLSLVSLEANVVATLAVALLYCFLAATTWAVRPLALRAVAVLVAYTPIIAAYAAFASYRLALASALAFVAADYTAPPPHQANLPAGVFCRTTGWGAAFTDEGGTVHGRRG